MSEVKLVCKQLNEKYGLGWGISDKALKMIKHFNKIKKALQFETVRAYQFKYYLRFS